MTQKEALVLLKNKQYDKLIELLIKEEPLGPQITSPLQVYRNLKPYSVKKQEHFIVITLDGAYQIINIHEVTRGIANRTLIHPREIFAPAIQDRAVAIIISHNHPAGQVGPSEDDIEITRRLVKAGELLGIPVLDHVIIGRDNYSSMKGDRPSLFGGEE
jgi:DNA repair protein RadC